MPSLAVLVTIALALFATAGPARFYLSSDLVFDQLLGEFCFLTAAEAVLGVAGEVLGSILFEMGK